MADTRNPGVTRLERTLPRTCAEFWRRTPPVILGLSRLPEGDYRFDATTATAQNQPSSATTHRVRTSPLGALREMARYGASVHQLEGGDGLAAFEAFRWFLKEHGVRADPDLPMFFDSGGALTTEYGNFAGDGSLTLEWADANVEIGDRTVRLSRVLGVAHTMLQEVVTQPLAIPASPDQSPAATPQNFPFAA